MYTAEQINELIQALRKCKEAACNSCKYECCQDITVDAADALTAITAENEALTHERDKLSKLLKAECAISNSHNDTIARLQAELAALKEAVTTAVELINEESQRHRGKTENVGFHGGVIYALGYAIGVLPYEFTRPLPAAPEV